MPSRWVKRRRRTASAQSFDDANRVRRRRHDRRSGRAWFGCRSSSDDSHGTNHASRSRHDDAADVPGRAGVAGERSSNGADVGRLLQSRGAAAHRALVERARTGRSSRRPSRRTPTIPADVTWNGITVHNVGIRSRGLGSRSSTKPGLRVDFDRYNERPAVSRPEVVRARQPDAGPHRHQGNRGDAVLHAARHSARRAKRTRAST